MDDALPLMTDTDIAILRVTAESRRGMKSPHVLVHYEAQLRLLATLDAARAERDEAREEVRAAFRQEQAIAPELAALRALADAVEARSWPDGREHTAALLAAVRAAQGPR